MWNKASTEQHPVRHQCCLPHLFLPRCLLAFLLCSSCHRKLPEKPKKHHRRGDPGGGPHSHSCSVNCGKLLPEEAALAGIQSQAKSFYSFLADMPSGAHLGGRPQVSTCSYSCEPPFSPYLSPNAATCSRTQPFSSEQKGQGDKICLLSAPLPHSGLCSICGVGPGLGRPASGAATRWTSCLLVHRLPALLSRGPVPRPPSFLLSACLLLPPNY